MKLSRVVPWRTFRFALALTMFVLITSACADAIPSLAVETSESPSVDIQDCGWMRWMDEPLKLEAWFEGHPEIAALHRWDSPSGRFQSARRDSIDDAQFDTLVRTMVVWRESSSANSPNMIDVDVAGGVIQLRAGLNLVRWWGREGSSFTIRDAFRWIGPSIESIERFDGQTQTCRRDIGAEPTQARDLAATLTRGDLLAVDMREDATWTLSWIWSPTYASFGEIDLEAHVELSEQVREVSGFIAARYGLASSSYVVMLLSDVDSMSEAYRALTGNEFDSSWWPDEACGVAWGGGIGLLTDCRDPVAFDHEFVHVIQAQLASGGIGSSWETEPAWLIEGAAEYISARYRDTMRYETYADARMAAIDYVHEQGSLIPLDRLETRKGFRGIDAGYSYSLGMLAAEWLAAHAGDKALFEHMRQLSRAGTNWDLAFEIAFGLSVEEFYKRFEQHAVEFEEPRPHLITGVLLNQNGLPAEKFQMHAYPWTGGRSRSAETDVNGRFEIEVRFGTYRLAVHNESSCTGYGYQGQSGSLEAWASAAPIAAGQANTEDLIVQLPAAASELQGWSTCREAEGRKPIRGRVLSPGGEGVKDVQVLACGSEDCGRSVTDETGAFSIDVAEESVLLMLGPGDSSCELWGARGTNGELIPLSGERPTNEIRRRSDRVDIQLSAPPEQLESVNICW